MEMLPLGTLAVLGIKFILILPENTVAMLIYKRIEKHLEKIQFEEYSSRVTVYLSTGIKYLAIKMIKLAQKMVIYISSHEIEQVEQTILDLIKAIEYKKAAVQVRNEVGRSTYRRQFSKSDSLNESVDSIDENQLAAPTNDKPLESPRPGFRKTEIGERMSKILIDLDEEKDYKIKAK
jgi:6-phosphogluconate dehydrogenase